jgi:isopenicillin-N N-acyltransferase-like protein
MSDAVTHRAKAPTSFRKNVMRRREFLRTTAAFVAGAGMSRATPALDEFPAAQVFTGTPRERGLAYGRSFREGIARFLAREIYGAFVGKSHTKDEVRRYAAACGREIEDWSPEVHAELMGIAEGAEIGPEEAVLITLHEELYHRGVLPKVEHCTAIAAAPPVTRDGRAYLGQTWDWLESVYGTSRMLRWKREAGPELLAYGFPGMPVGAGLNSAGLALCWTSADLGDHALGARVGIPSYVLLTHLLYQKSLDAAAAEAKRAKNAGWFTFVMADGDGRMLNLEGSPAELAIEWGKGRMVRSGFASEQMKRRKQGPHTNNARCDAANQWLDGASGKVDAAAFREFFTDRQSGICAGKATIDVMLFDTTTREAHLSRGPHHKVAWKSYRFD